MNDSIRINLIRGFVGLFFFLCFNIVHAQSVDDINDPIEEVVLPEMSPPPAIKEEVVLSPIEQIEHDTEEFLTDLRFQLDNTTEGLVTYAWYHDQQLNMDKEIKCLAQNIYYEARGESMSGQLAIALVTINRLKMQDYPPTICQIVFQPKQFSWTRTHKKKYVPHDQQRWAEAMTIAHRVLEGGRLDNVKDITGGSILFHAVYVHPKSWKTHYNKTMQIGKHIFFKAKKEFQYRSDPVVTVATTNN